MIAVVVLARVVLAAVFGVAGAAKLADRDGSRRSLRAFGLPERLVAVLAIAELAAAGLLIAPQTATVGAIVALTLLAAFTVAIVAALRRGSRPDCGCFGRLHSAPIGRSTFVRNALLAACAAVVLIRPTATVTDWAVAVGAVAVIHAAFSWQLLRQNGRLWRRLEALERRA
jgi:Methylamine utilisation protein MauE